MTPAEYGLYVHLREVSHPHKYQYRFDDRTLADRFSAKRGASRATINRLRRSLVALKFIEWLEPKKLVGGKFSTRLGRILSHKEWEEKHPGKCLHNALTGDSASSEEAESPCSKQEFHRAHSEGDRAHSDDSPCSKEAAHRAHGRAVNRYYKSINTTPSLTDMASAAFFEKENTPPLDSADRQSHLVPPCSPVSTVIPPLGLHQRDGEWFTESGVKVHDDALAVLFGKGNAA